MANKHSEEVLVSIIIPVYNREQIIAETIACATNQTYKNIEVIISDNCSTDNTWNVLLALAEDDDRIQLYRNTENLGPVLNWKAALDKSSGHYLKILWSDDLISKNFIEEGVRLLKDDEVGFVLSKTELVEGASKSTIETSTYQIKKKYSSSEYLYNVLIYNKLGFFMSPGNAIFRTADVRKNFIIDISTPENLDFKKYGAGNDLWLMLCAAASNKTIAIMENATSFFRVHKDSISIEKATEIEHYYEWAKCKFIATNNTKFTKMYKSKLFIAKYLRKDLQLIYKEARGTTNVIALGKYLLSRYLAK